MSLIDSARRALSTAIPKTVQDAVTKTAETVAQAATAQLKPLGDIFQNSPQVAQVTPVGMPNPQPAAVDPAPKSFPMKGDATLAQVANGQMELGPGAKGESVTKMQDALMTAGYKLPKYGADGDFGGETTRALKDFQSKNGLEPTGRLNAETVQKLDTAAASKLKSPEYDKLYKDGVLNTTIAVGYDEDGNHTQQIKQTIEGLDQRGYKQLDVKNASDDDLKKAGIDPAKVDRDATYYVKSYQHEGKDVKGVVKLITPDTPNAKEKFAKAMNEDEVVMYTGHGRVGSGPDFDDKHSAAGNYVIGKPTVANYATLGENDLKKAKMTDDYQLLFFDGCNTKHYVDDLRSIPKNKDSKNMDIVGANTELSWSTSSADVLTMLDGVEGGKSMNEIQSNLETINKEGPKDKHKHFMTDGFQDND